MCLKPIPKCGDLVYLGSKSTRTYRLVISDDTFNEKSKIVWLLEVQSGQASNKGLRVPFLFRDEAFFVKVESITSVTWEAPNSEANVREVKILGPIPSEATEEVQAKMVSLLFAKRLK